ncbi:MAG: hypothetical protein J7621_16650 [Niastella sp.]|nr:hypothetical protein [Niastella sp.]
MSEKKTFLVPVYMLAFSFLIGAIFEWPAVVNTIRNRHLPQDSFSFSMREYWINRLLNIGIIGVIILVECLVYWRIRKSKYRKDFAVGHAIGIMLALVGLPVGSAIFQYFTDFSIASEETTRTIRIMNTIYGGLLKVFFIMAHVCFALVLISLWKNRKNRSVDVVAGEKDILNEYTDR